jgi:uncharacterized protein YbaR (Trm112 family)
MANVSSDPMNAIASWIHDLACPACHQSLQIKNTSFVCAGCQRIYPVLDGIPVLIAERASLPESSRQDAF